jgi:hypothetical protein
MQHDAVRILIAGVLLATGVAASLAAARVRLPGSRRVPRHRHVELAVRLGLTERAGAIGAERLG